VGAGRQSGEKEVHEREMKKGPKLDLVDGRRGCSGVKLLVRK